ncbi:hypothetical protein KY345_01420 [Candidatus Woesearchaeota archaeon]|nr:hypothetical protein [Candidatus Woesearchaeota archaeon]
MGILDKLMFWKKGEEDLGELGLGGEGFGKEAGLGKDLTGLEGVGTGKAEMPGYGEREHEEGIGAPLGAAPEAPPTQEVGAPAGYGAPSPYAAPAAAPERHEQLMIGKELELITTKLDSLKVTLDSINIRLASLERIAKGEYEKTW